MTTNEPSGSHLLPPVSESRGIVLEIKHVVAVAAFLGIGGVGAGVVTIGGQHSQSPAVVPAEVTTALAEINAKLTVMNAKLDVSGKTLDDHETRLRALEKRLTQR